MANTIPATDAIPHLIGIGLRPHQYHEWLQKPPEQVCFLEAMTDNYLGHKGGPARSYLNQIGEMRCLLLHGVGLNIGSCEDFCQDYVGALRELVAETKPVVVSDHLSFTGISGYYTHSLLPLPRTKPNAYHVNRKLAFLNETIKHPLALENPSRYLTFTDNELSEAEFLVETIRGTGSQMLLDINNLFITCTNEGSDPFKELAKIPKGSVAQYHIAGHQDRLGYLYDTHSGDIKPEVWELLGFALEVIGEAPVILERDDHKPMEITLEDWRCGKLPSQLSRSGKVEKPSKLHGISLPIPPGNPNCQPERLGSS